MSSAELEKRIMEWLSTQGYPLEMRVADMFASRGFNVTQSDYYSDPTTEVQREIDVSAYMQELFDPVLLRLRMLVECKAEKSKPWVVFVSDRVRLADRARVVQRSATRFGAHWLRLISVRKDVTDLGIFHLPPHTGYGITAAFSQGQDVPYSALLAIAGAAHAEAVTGERIGRRQGQFASIHFPVVVTDAPLFACSLARPGELQLEKIDRTVVVWRNPVYRLPHSIINIVQTSAIEDFTNEVAEDFAYLLSNTEQEIRQLTSA